MGEENFSRIVLEFDFKEKKAGGILFRAFRRSGDDKISRTCR